MSEMYYVSVPYLIDGNNLLYAASAAGLDVGRGELCRLMGDFAQHRRDRLCVVFDGPQPAGPLAEQIGDERIEVVYSAPRTADEIIEDRIVANTAPRRLTVVSSDRQVRRAGRRRRCNIVISPDFADMLLRLLKRPKKTPDEPPEKRAGLTEEQTRAWLKEFGIDS